MHFTVLAGFAKEVTPRTCTKTVIPRNHLQPLRGMHDKPSLFSSRYLGRNGCQAGYENRKIKSNQTLFFKYHAAGIMIISCGL